MAKIRVLIADDHAILREGLQLLIKSQADLEVVGQASSVHDLLREAEHLDPDVICLDLIFPDGRGLKAVARLRAVCPRVKILVVTAHNETAYLHAAMAEGVNGYVVKSAPGTELLSAIREVHQHRMVVLLDSADENVLNSFPRSNSSEADSSGLDCLSPRERQVLELLVFGYTNQQVADRLFLSVKTVETHRARLLSKLGLRDRADLIRYAIELGLFTTDRVSAAGQQYAETAPVNPEDDSSSFESQMREDEYLNNKLPSLGLACGDGTNGTRADRSTKALPPPKPETNSVVWIKHRSR